MEREKEFKEVFTRIKATFIIREGTLILFTLTVFLLETLGYLYYYNHFNLVAGTIVVWLISSYIFRYLAGKQKTAFGLITLYFFYDVLVELPLIALIIYYAGGIEWLGSIFFLFPIVYISIVLPRSKAILIHTIASIYYILLVLLPYYDLVPFYSYFPLGIKLYQNAAFVTNNLLFTIASFYLIGLAANLFTDLLKKKTIELESIKEETEKEKGVLEVRVMARTRELEEVAKGLEKKVKERTKEVEEEKQGLERFNKLAVGRELKMIALKKRIKNLEDRLEK